MNPWTIVLPLAIALLTVALNALVAVKIKFAPDEVSAWRGLKAAAVKLGSAIFGLLLMAGLAFNVFRDGPPSRVDVFSIAFQTMSLGLTVVFRVLGRVTEVQRKHIKWTRRLLEHTFGPKPDSAKASPE
jgi:hypothetical protein